LADEFTAGAQGAGHEVRRFDAAFSQIGPCFACDTCLKNGGICVQKDDMLRLKELLHEADMIVFVTPLYYFGMSAQLKSVIDRFYGINALLAGKKSALMATCADDEAAAPMDALVAHYELIMHYLKLRDCGRLLAFGVSARQEIEKSAYPAQARAFGRSLK